MNPIAPTRPGRAASDNLSVHPMTDSTATPQLGLWIPDLYPQAGGRNLDSAAAAYSRGLLSGRSWASSSRYTKSTLELPLVRLANRGEAARRWARRFSSLERVFCTGLSPFFSAARGRRRRAGTVDAGAVVCFVVMSALVRGRVVERVLLHQRT